MKRPFAAIHSLLFLPLIFCSMKSGASTVAVGNCIPHVTSYNTISEAVAAVPANSTVLVCPGTYPEQITFSTALTLRGYSTTSPPLITVPAEGLTGPQISVVPSEGLGPPVTVNLINLVVDGNGASGATGIYYSSDSGLLSKLEIRHESVAISIDGDPEDENTVDLADSYIHDFTNTGIGTFSVGSTSNFVNIRRSRIQSNNTIAQWGVESYFTEGSITDSVILLRGGTGLLLNNFFPGVSVERNYIEGADVGIESQIGGQEVGNVIQNNVLFNNATGIDVSNIGGGDSISANIIAQSSVQAIDLECSNTSAVESNVISNTPLGIADYESGVTFKSNKFFNVGTQKTRCQH
jgi:hypothetical protein